MYIFVEAVDAVLQIIKFRLLLYSTNISTKTNYFSMFVCLGLSAFNGVALTNQPHQVSWQKNNCNNATCFSYYGDRKKRHSQQKLTAFQPINLQLRPSDYYINEKNLVLWLNKGKHSCYVTPLCFRFKMLVNNLWCVLYELSHVVPIYFLHARLRIWTLSFF